MPISPQVSTKHDQSCLEKWQLCNICLYIENKYQKFYKKSSFGDMLMVNKWSFYHQSKVRVGNHFPDFLNDVDLLSFFSPQNKI